MSVKFNKTCLNYFFLLLFIYSFYAYIDSFKISFFKFMLICVQTNDNFFKLFFILIFPRSDHLFGFQREKKKQKSFNLSWMLLLSISNYQRDLVLCWWDCFTVYALYWVGVFRVSRFYTSVCVMSVYFQISCHHAPTSRLFFFSLLYYY